MTASNVLITIVGICILFHLLKTCLNIAELVISFMVGRKLLIVSSWKQYNSSIYDFYLRELISRMSSTPTRLWTISRSSPTSWSSLTAQSTSSFIWTRIPSFSCASTTASALASRVPVRNYVVQLQTLRPVYWGWSIPNKLSLNLNLLFKRRNCSRHCQYSLSERSKGMSNITHNNSTSTTNNTSTVSHISNKGSGDSAVAPTEELSLLQLPTLKCDILNDSESAKMTRKI